MELKINSLEEELQDLKSDKESLEWVRIPTAFIFLSGEVGRNLVVYCKYA